MMTYFYVTLTFLAFTFILLYLETYYAIFLCVYKRGSPLQSPNIGGLVSSTGTLAAAPERCGPKSIDMTSNWISNSFSFRLPRAAFIRRLVYVCVSIAFEASGL